MHFGRGLSNGHPPTKTGLPAGVDAISEASFDGLKPPNEAKAATDDEVPDDPEFPTEVEAEPNPEDMLAW